MPELPEVEVTRLGVAPHILNQTIQTVTVRNYRLRWEIPKGLPEMLTNGIISNVARRSKYIIILVTSSTHKQLGHLIIHLGMSGTLRIANGSSPFRTHDHWDIVMKNGVILRYNDPRRFGSLRWISDLSINHLDQHPIFQKIGHEPLDEKLSATELWDKLRSTNLSIKQVLLNGNVICGVGNIYACESLFLAKIHPQTRASDLTLNRTSHLLTAIRAVLQDAISLGGSTLNDFHSPHGTKGYFQLHANVYGRVNQPCHRCSHSIMKIVQNQRSTFYCPECQT